MKFIRAFTSNSFTLLLSFIVAVLIWINAVQANDPIRAEFLPVTIQFIGQPENTLLVRPAHEQTVQIWFQGASSVVTGISSDDFSATADLSGVSLGEETFVPIQVRSTVKGITILSQSPEETAVYIEEQITRKIPVVLDIRGQVALGHEMGEPFIDPPFITITGPSGQVEAMAVAEGTLFLNNERETAVYTLTPIFYDEQGDVVSINNLNITPETVDVTIPVNQAEGFAEKVIVVDIVGTLPDGYRLLSVTATPSSVLLQGTPGDLGDITSIATEPVDITGLTEATRYQVALILPDGVTMAEATEEIFVDINIEPFMTTETFQPEIEVQGVGDGLEATVDPTAVRVVLFGPLPVLDSILLEEIHATIDLFGLEEGVYSIEPIITFPDRGVELRSVNPPNVTVEITTTITDTQTITDTTTLP